MHMGHKITRRRLLGAASSAAVLAGAGDMLGMETRAMAETAATPRQGISDGPASSLFTPIPIPGGTALDGLAGTDLSDVLRGSLKAAPVGECVCWGIPFQVERVALIRAERVAL